MIREKTGYDVVIVGGGLGGLETGALLAQAKARMLVLERRNILGGRAMTVEQKGFVLNYGLHYMMGGYESPHYRILRQIGKADQVAFAPMDTAKIFRLRGGKLHRVPASTEDMMTTELLSLEGKMALTGAMTSLFQADVEGLWNVPLNEWLNQNVNETSLRQFLLDLAGPTAFAAEPGLMSTGHFLTETRKILTANGPLAIYPAGGWGALSEACRQVIEAAGGEVRTGVRVSGLKIEENGVSGVWTGDNQGSLIPTRAVVLALPPGEIVPLVRDHSLPDLSADRLERIHPVRGIAVNLGFMGVPNHEIATIEMPEDNATSGFHNLFQPQLAPENGLLFQGLRWLTGDQKADESEIRRTEEMFLTRLSTLFPGIREQVVLRRTLVRDVVLGADHLYDQPRTDLPPVKVASVEGLYLVGDATDAPGELSATVGESALLCAQHIQEQAARQPEWSLAARM